MTMMTRATAKRLEAEAAAAAAEVASNAAIVNLKSPARAAPPTPVTRSETLIQVTVSKTGLGTHTRWIRPGEPLASALGSDSAMDEDAPMDEDVPEHEDNSGRYTTPVPSIPHIPQAPWAPRKTAERPQGRVTFLQPEDTFQHARAATVARNMDRSPGRRGLFEDDNTIQWQNAPSSPTQRVGTPKAGALQRKPQGLRREDCMMEDEFTKSPVRKVRALGPCGTFLVDEYDKPIYREVPLIEGGHTPRMIGTSGSSPMTTSRVRSAPPKDNAYHNAVNKRKAPAACSPQAPRQRQLMGPPSSPPRTRIHTQKASTQGRVRF
ncbi:hypothetical protein BDQ17DRAFT_1428056 [Cyathus striatus]|nr:hypothetical protein BDQ17DRAFT_1428056 [Cyathus striatus]